MTDRFTHRLTDRDLERLLREGAAGDAPRFDAGFADRVMARVAAERDARRDAQRDAPPLDLALWRQFRRIVPAAAAAALVLGALNWWATRDSGASPLAGAAGLPAVTLAAAFSSAVTPVALAAPAEPGGGG
jgi:hypothetical protein